MKVAYADPPYIGCGAYYAERVEVDHGVLIARLVAEYPDGWALSCHSPSLRALLPLCPGDIRVAAWVKPWCSYKPNVNPAYAWEPVLWRGGRQRRPRPEVTVRDWHSARASTGRGMKGAKPDSFSFWLFTLLGVGPGDEFVDLYPGTGGVTSAWASWCAQPTLFGAETAAC